MAFLTKFSFRRVAESIFGVSYIQAGEVVRRMQDEAMAGRMDYEK